MNQADSLELLLKRGQLVRTRRPMRITVAEGRLWVTETGKHADVFVREGQEILVGDSGLALIEAVGDARLCVRPSHGIVSFAALKQAFQSRSVSACEQALTLA